ncbi:MAG TPA: helix-turn-helix domain-containing protein [Trebonia sp.]|jgi:DNA-binding transcriptional ArsR family regulator|nr:helix-turn-helix domain-containing protein [Trebonia sp.]
MIELRVAAGEFAHMRFACSPISEAVSSLHALHSGRVHPLHRNWSRLAFQRLRRCDTAVLRAFVPGGNCTPSLPVGCLGGSAMIEDQLRCVADWSTDLLRSELEDLWSGAVMPAAARQLIADGSAAPRRLADALSQYWDLVLRPYWNRIRAVLDAEVLYQGRQLAERGVVPMMTTLHPQLELRGDNLYLDRCPSARYDLNGQNLLLIPSVFVWPRITFDPGIGGGPPSLMYGSRGVGTVWETAPPVMRATDDPLGAMLGPARAAILRRTGAPKSTTDLARELLSSAPTVSAHLAILKRCGMVTSWRSGRSVLYQRTSLASSVLASADDEPPGYADHR